MTPAVGRSALPIRLNYSWFEEKPPFRYRTAAKRVDGDVTDLRIRTPVRPGFPLQCHPSLRFATEAGILMDTLRAAMLASDLRTLASVFAALS
jgi:hypothetical protein